MPISWPRPFVSIVPGSFYTGMTGLQDRLDAKGGAGGQKGVVGNEPELEFYDHVPTVWDDTKVMHGAIGDYAVLARRSGEDWFVGCMNSGEPRTLSVPFHFSTRGQKPMLLIFIPMTHRSKRETHVRIDRYRVDSRTVFETSMTAQGGQAIRLVSCQTRGDLSFLRAMKKRFPHAFSQVTSSRSRRGI